ncbi:MAG: AAA family ATPase [Myxococcota bacterium]|nr:AAA family ATPase [Myxococcota bacterium]
MFIEYLEARNFRNLTNLSLNLEPNILILEGDNAQGKTNILEALYVCATGRSFRNALPSQLLHHGKDSGVIRARFVRQGVRHDIEVILGSKRRGMKVDGRVLRQASKLLELINVVAFFPEDLRIARGQPEQRRRFIDRVVANREPAFVTSASKYAKAIK